MNLFINGVRVAQLACGPGWSDFRDWLYSFPLDNVLAVRQFTDEGWTERPELVAEQLRAALAAVPSKKRGVVDTVENLLWPLESPSDGHLHHYSIATDCDDQDDSDATFTDDGFSPGRCSVNQAAKEMMELFAKWYDDERIEYLRRGLVCTPFESGDRKPVGWVVCVRGSPPKGTLVLFGAGPPANPPYYLCGKCKRVVGAKQSQVIKRFYELHLKGTEKAVTIWTEPFFATEPSPS